MKNISTQNEPSKTFTRRDIHQEVTDAIIEQLEAGTAPWHQPWLSQGNQTPLRLPMNATTGKAYQGINVLLLWNASMKQEFASHEYATFKQWNEKKETIRKGEKGNMIVYFDMLEKEVDGEIKKMPFLKSSVVFNRCQLANYKPEDHAPIEACPMMEVAEKAKRFIDNTNIVIKHTGYKACYNFDKDEIYIPQKNNFINTEHSSAAENYYSTLFHELIHSTGHPSRLDRQFGEKFGDNTYAGEELIAELGAAFLCAEFEITNTPKLDHANYLAHWLGILKENKYAIIGASSFASKAADYLYWLQP